MVTSETAGLEKPANFVRNVVDMFILGLTGGIATGKSTVCNVFKELGCSVVDADEIAREGTFLEKILGVF